MKIKRRNSILIIFITILLLGIVLIIKNLYFYKIYTSNLILKNDNQYILLLNGEEVILEGLAGNAELSEDKKKILFLKTSLNGNVEIAEMDVEERNVKILITANEIENAIELNKNKNEHIESIQYVPERKAVSFICKNSLYIMNLEDKHVQCVLENLEQSKITVDGESYLWLDEDNLLYYAKDNKKKNVIYKYNITTQEKQLLQYGWGVDSSPQNGQVVIYGCYVKNSTNWIKHHKFTVYDINLVEVQEEYEYKKEYIFRSPQNVIFSLNPESEIIWTEKEGNYVIVYDCKKDRQIFIWLGDKKVYSIL